MTINFLYCIDYPTADLKHKPTDRIAGWIICSHKIKKIEPDKTAHYDFGFEYGINREDVAKSFKDFPQSHLSGFKITAGKKLIDCNEPIHLVAYVETNTKKIKKIPISIDPYASNIQDIDIEKHRWISDFKWKRTEKKYLKTLKKHPWITIRMDISNKCNLKCIMCHYKEQEIYSRPAKYITAHELKEMLKDIAPYVKHIMLSCGYEPLMSKHFYEIVKMLHEEYPHMEIGLCTNGMLLNSAARKAIIEYNITHVLLSLDGVSKTTVEKIRVGANFEKIVSNIMALRDLKRKFNKNFPLMFMDFVLMNSNIHEAPAFVELCKELGIDVIDFRHMVGNIYYSEHEEMLSLHQEKYNYYRKLIIEEARKQQMKVRLPEPFNTDKTYTPETTPEIDFSYKNITPDPQTEEVEHKGDFVMKNNTDKAFDFLSDCSCLRPFNEIMIHEHNKIMPCSYYGDIMGVLDENNSLHSIFFNEKFRKVRRKKKLSQFDFKCVSCPIKSNQLPTELA